MGFWRNLRSVIYKLDFFYTAEVLRYKQEPEYRTIFGGILSISIIIMLLVTFYNKIIDTFGKVIISSSTSALNAIDPIPYNISTMDGQPFMLGVQIWHHNLNSNPRYFDVVLTSAVYDNGIRNDSKSVKVPLQACTKQHWSLYPKIQQSYDRLNINYWLCLPKNAEFEIYGKYASVTSKTLEVSVSRCTNSTDFTYPCAPDAAIDQFFQDEQTFFYTIYFINPLLNADSQEYLSHYLQDSNYVIFSATDGEECQLWMQDYTITTDESIIPFESYDVKAGGMVTKNCIKNRYSIDPSDPSPLYSTMSFFKSPISKKIERSYQKLDEILSYIGGLFGTIAICLFLVNIYNSYSFEIAMGSYLFKPKDYEMQKQLKKYNFFYFILQLVYAVFKVFKCTLNWESAKLYYECREQMIKQLDVLYLYRRVIFLERAIEMLFSQGQLKALHLKQRSSLLQAQDFRKRHKINHDYFMFTVRSLSKDTGRQQNFIKSYQQKQQRIPKEQKSQDLHIVSGDQLNNKIVKNISHLFDKSLGQSLTKMHPQHQYDQSSDSEDGDQRKATVKDLIADLANLCSDRKKIQLSQRIWNSLEDSVRTIILTSKEGQLKHDYYQTQQNVAFESREEGSCEVANQALAKQRKTAMFTKLPKITVAEKVKVVQKDSPRRQSFTGRIDQQSLDKFVEFQDFSVGKNSFEEL